MKLMARLMRVLPMQATTNLSELAVVMKPEVETDSTYRRLQRFFAKFDFGYQRLGQFLLDLVPTDPPYVLSVDGIRPGGQRSASSLDRPRPQL
jgi:hypothetical protein